MNLIFNPIHNSGLHKKYIFFLNSLEVKKAYLLKWEKKNLHLFLILLASPAVEAGFYFCLFIRNRTGHQGSDLSNKFKVKHMNTPTGFISQKLADAHIPIISRLCKTNTTPALYKFASS